MSATTQSKTMQDYPPALTTRITDSGLSASVQSRLFDWVHAMLVLQGFSRATVLRYVDHVIAFLTWRGATGYPVDGVITPSQVESWLKALFTGKSNVAATRNNKLAAIKTFSRWGERINLADPQVQSLRHAKQPRTLPRKFSQAQLAALFASPDRTTHQGLRDHALLLFLYATGCRRQEVVNVNLEDLVLKANSGAVLIHGKGSKERMVSFSEPVVRTLEKWILTRDHIHPMQDRNALWLAFSHPNRGGRISIGSINRIVTTSAKRAGFQRLNAWPHKLRSTFATDLFDDGVDLLVIKSLLGHSDVRTTEKYICMSDRRLRTAIQPERLAAILGKAAVLPGYLKQKLQHRIVTSTE